MRALSPPSLANATGVGRNLLMMLSPIAYTARMVPEGLRVFLKVNPRY